MGPLVYFLIWRLKPSDHNYDRAFQRQRRLGLMRSMLGCLEDCKFYGPFHELLCNGRDEMQIRMN